MARDLVIRAGLIDDGLGNAPFPVDLAIDDDAKDAILNGLPRNWASYGESLDADAVALLRPAINALGLVGHSASRLRPAQSCLPTRA